MANPPAVQEICAIEGDDDLHEFGGGHGNKGNDFARFWLIRELLQLTQDGNSDYLFVLEYVQDVVRFDSAEDPTSITLYQLKKKEGRNWDLNTLVGLTKKGTSIKLDSPLAKLLKGTLAFNALNASAEFVSNSHFDVGLESGQSAISMDLVGLHELAESPRKHINEGISSAHGVLPANVPLDKVSLRYVPMAINDMRVHVIGAAHAFLKNVSAKHAAQADSFVDALFAELATASRNTTKCRTWAELIAKRGYSREKFQDALKTLQLLPDADELRMSLLKVLAPKKGWRTREEMKVELALAELARFKLCGGDPLMPIVDWQSLKKICEDSEKNGWDEVREHDEIVNLITKSSPNEEDHRLRALAIYAMVKIWLSQASA